MGTWGLIQIVINIFLGLGLFILATRLQRGPKDDPRLSRGLQLLQSKIAVLEDLSDRTEVQVNQMTSLLEQKCKEVQSKIQAADRHVQLIKASMEKSLEVARIFQDKIPHEEIIERQNTAKYVKAARLAHQGYSIEELAKEVDLPKGELEFIAKVNKDQLMFSEDQLPWWAGSETGDSAGEHSQQNQLVHGLEKIQFEMDHVDMYEQSANRDYTKAFETPEQPTSLEKLGEEFRRACEDEQVAHQEHDEYGDYPVTAAQAAPVSRGGFSFEEAADDETPAPDQSNSSLSAMVGSLMSAAGQFLESEPESAPPFPNQMPDLGLPSTRNASRPGGSAATNASNYNLSQTQNLNVADFPAGSKREGVAARTAPKPAMNPRSKAEAATTKVQAAIGPKATAQKSSSMQKATTQKGTIASSDAIVRKVEFRKINKPTDGIS